MKHEIFHKHSTNDFKNLLNKIYPELSDPEAINQCNVQLRMR